MGNSEGSLMRKESKKERNGFDNKSTSSYKASSKKRGIIKDSVSRSAIYNYDLSSSSKQNSPSHNQDQEQPGILRTSKESSPNKTENFKPNKNKIRDEEINSNGLTKKSHHNSDQEKEFYDQSQSPRSHDRDDSPKSPLKGSGKLKREVEGSDEESIGSRSHSDDDDDETTPHNHLPSFIKPENKVLPTVVPVKPLHQTEFGAILQQGGSITRKKQQEQKEAELKQLEFLYQQTRLKEYNSNYSLHSQDYSDREQNWSYSMPDIPPIDYDIPPPDYDDDIDNKYGENVKKSKKKTKLNKNQKGNLEKNRKSLLSSPISNIKTSQAPEQYTWDSETEWYIISKTERKKKKEKENKGKKGKTFINSLQRTESVNESSSPKKGKKNKISKRSISLGPGESSLREKWRNSDWLRIKKKENKDSDESIASKKKSRVKKLNEFSNEEEWRNPNNPYTSDIQQYNDYSPGGKKQSEKYKSYLEKSYSKEREYYDESQKNFKLREKEFLDENIEKMESNEFDRKHRQKEIKKNSGHKNQTESSSDDYHKKVNKIHHTSENPERKLHSRQSPQKVDATTSTSLDDIKLPPPRKKGKKKALNLQEENFDQSKTHYQTKSPTKFSPEDNYEKRISSDEEISRRQKYRLHKSSNDINYSPEYRSNDFTSSRMTKSSQNLFREEDNSITKEVKHSFENVISEMNYNEGEKKQEVMFGSSQSEHRNQSKNLKVSPAVKNLKERNEHLQEEKIKELRERSCSPWNQTIEMNLRPTVPKREFKMPPNFSPTQTWKVFNSQTLDNEEDCLSNSNDDIHEEKIEKIVRPSIPSRGPKIITTRIEKDVSSSEESDDNVDLYRGFTDEKQYLSRKKSWTPAQDLADEIEPPMVYHPKYTPVHSPQAHLSMPSNMFSSKPNQSRLPTSKLSLQHEKEDSSDSGSKFNSINRIKESVKHAVGLKSKASSSQHLDANWSLVKGNSSEDERPYTAKLSGKTEQKEKYIFGESFAARNQNSSAFKSYSPSGHVIYLPNYQRPASVDLFEKKTHKVARAYSFQNPEKFEEKQRFVEHVSRQAEEREQQRELEKARIQKVEEEFRRQREKRQLIGKNFLSRSDADVHKLTRERLNSFSPNYHNSSDWNNKQYYKESSTDINDNRRKNIYEKNVESKADMPQYKYYRYDNFQNNDEAKKRQWKSVDSLGYNSQDRNMSPDNRVQSLWMERTRIKSPSPERGLKRSQSQRVSQEIDHHDSRQRAQSSERFLQRSHSQRIAELRKTLFGDKYNNDNFSNDNHKSHSRYLGQSYQTSSPYFYKGEKINRAQSEIAVNRDHQKERWFEESRGRDKLRSKTRSYGNSQGYSGDDRMFNGPNSRYSNEMHRYVSKTKITSPREEFSRYSNDKDFHRTTTLSSSNDKGLHRPTAPSSSNSKDFHRIAAPSSSDLLSSNSRSVFSKRHQEDRTADV